MIIYSPHFVTLCHLSPLIGHFHLWSDKINDLPFLENYIEPCDAIAGHSFHFLPGSLPSLKDLTLLWWTDDEGKIHRFHLLRKVSGDWLKAGLLLGLTTAELWDIMLKMDDNERRFAFVFRKWIADNGHPPEYPLSWDGVCELLSDLDKEEVAEELRQAIKGKDGVFFFFFLHCLKL